jgi:hypothetical protein
MSTAVPLPLGLSHQPVVLLPYAAHDGHYTPDTDAAWLSLGFATWGDHSDLSLKVFRHTGDKFSRQSEELPPHRVLDLAILLMLAIEQMEAPPITVAKNTFHNQPEELELPLRGSAIELYAARQRLADPMLAQRFGALHRVLDRVFGHQPVLAQ